MPEDNDPYAPQGVPQAHVPQPGMGDPRSYLPPDSVAPSPIYGSTPIPPPPPPPGYGAGPSFGSPPAPPVPYGMGYQAAGNDSRNVLGILALIMPFIGLSLVGIVLGHLGLSAVKKGLANNRGIALAGTIVSYVFTFLSIVWFAFVIVIAASGDSFSYTSDAEDMRTDLTSIGQEVAVYWVDGEVPPTVRVDGDEYVVGDATVPVTVDNPQITYTGDTASNWCVELESDATTRIASYSAQAGYQDWFDCETAISLYGEDDSEDFSPPAPTGEAFENATAISLYDLEVGDCILDPYETGVYDEDTDTYTLWDVYVVPCEQPHYEEVALVDEFTDAEYPGLDAILERLEGLCQTAFEDYVGIEYIESEYYFDYFYPTEGSWDIGDREYTCLVYGTDGLTGSVAGAAR